METSVPGDSLRDMTLVLPVNRTLFRPLTALVLAALIMAAGCRQDQGPSVLTFAVGGAPSELDYWEKLIKRFETESGLQVELIRQPTDTSLRRQNLVVALQAGMTDPDVFLLDVAWLAQFAASGWLEPLEKYMGPECAAKKDFFARVIALADTYDGQLIGLPVYVDGGLLYYRQDLLERFGLPGPPETWDQLLEYALLVQQKMRPTHPDFYGFVWQGAQYEGLICNFMEFTGSKGSFVFADGRPVLNSPANVDSLRFMHDLIHVHKVSPPNTYTEMREEETRTFFQQGNALFERNWPYAWALHQQPSSPVKGRIGLAPMPGHTPGSFVSTLGGWHIGLSAKSDNKDAGWKLICFLTSFATQKKLALQLGWNPGHTGIYRDAEVLAAAPHFKTLREVFQQAAPRPILPYYSQLSEILQKHLNDALAGNVAPGEALRRAEEEMLPIMQRYRQEENR